MGGVQVGRWGGGVVKGNDLEPNLVIKRIFLCKTYIFSDKCASHFTCINDTNAMKIQRKEFHASKLKRRNAPASNYTFTVIQMVMRDLILNKIPSLPLSVANFLSNIYRKLQKQIPSLE